MHTLDEVLSRDPWLASSLLQKAIRRGDASRAVAAAQAYQRRRGAGIWKRLAVIAMEDVGVADLQLVQRTVRAAFSKSRTGRSYAELIELVEFLASAAKDRSSDYLCSILTRSAAVEAERENAGTMTTEQLIATIVDEGLSTVRRAMACWYLSGINADDLPRFTHSRLDLLLSNLRAAGFSANAIDAAATAGELRHPFPVTLPILERRSVLCADVRNLSHELSSPTNEIGVPVYAFDKHTRLGKAANRRFLRECSEVREVVSDWANETKAAKVIDMATFYAEATQVRLKRDWPEATVLEAMGMKADMEFVGVPALGAQEIVATVRLHIEQLDAIRLKASTRNNGR